MLPESFFFKRMRLATANFSFQNNYRCCLKASFLNTTVSLKYDWLTKLLYDAHGTITSCKQNSEATYETHIPIIASMIVT